MSPVLYHPACRLHDPGRDHAECPERLDAILDALAAPPLLPSGAQPIITDRRATAAELSRVHTRPYVTRVLSLEGRAGRAGPEAPLSPGSVEAACRAAGLALDGVERAMRGERPFALCRPPGHHARAAGGMGFCVFNNAAVAAAAARAAGAERVLIVDWDVHHGNGTQEIFYSDPAVSFFSIHQSPLYPDSGHASERGAGAGLGATRNVPLPSGSDGADYLRAFREVLIPDAEAFSPDLILVSAGFDAHQGDPLGGMWLTAADYGRLCAEVRGIADRRCGGRMLLLLEGGYRLDTLGACARACVEALR